MTRTGTKFNVKDKRKKGHHLNLTYSVKSRMKNCPDSCNSETGRRLIERVNKHGKDINSHIFNYSIEGSYPSVTSDGFTVLSSVYDNKRFKRKVSE